MLWKLQSWGPHVRYGAREPEPPRKSQLYVVSFKENNVFYMVSFTKVSGTLVAPNGFSMCF